MGKQQNSQLFRPLFWILDIYATRLNPGCCVNERPSYSCFASKLVQLSSFRLKIPPADLPFTSLTAVLGLRQLPQLGMCLKLPVGTQYLQFPQIFFISNSFYSGSCFGLKTLQVSSSHIGSLPIDLPLILFASLPGF